MTNWLRCSISPGQFSDEFAVRGVLFDQSEFSLFAEKDDLRFDGEPTIEHPVEGWIRIMPGPRKDNLILVTLPKPTLENGRSVTVIANDVKTQG